MRTQPETRVLWWLAAGLCPPPTKELIRKVLLANLHPMEGSAAGFPFRTTTAPIHCSKQHANRRRTTHVLHRQCTRVQCCQCTRVTRDGQ